MTQDSLRQYLSSTLKNDPALVFLIEDIAAACRDISYRVRNAAFAGELGSAGSVNVQGEAQKPLDLIANDIVEQSCGQNSKLAALVSEEIEEVTWLKTPEVGDYLLYFDPLDGSSNLDVDVSVGTIFSVMQVRDAQSKDVLKQGTEQICAGYALYGPSTIFVLSFGQDVNGFTCKSGTGTYYLTHPKMTVPATTSEYAINAARRDYWEAPVRAYIDDCMLGVNGPRARFMNMRWIASMVAEVHRILVRGGVFLYPKDSNNAKAGGKLRLMYEANPMAFLIEAAGGKASTGHARILDIPPTEPHQRVPVILGSRDEVTLIEEYHQKNDAS